MKIFVAAALLLIASTNYAEDAPNRRADKAAE